MSIAKEIKQGLNEAIEYSQGRIRAKKTTMVFLPLSSFSAQEIKEIRLKSNLTQKAFACYLGVSVKTVEAWEAGRNHPDGVACRMLYLTQKDPDFPKKSGIIS